MILYSLRTTHTPPPLILLLILNSPPLPLRFTSFTPNIPLLSFFRFPFPHSPSVLLFPLPSDIPFLLLRCSSIPPSRFSLYFICFLFAPPFPFYFVFLPIILLRCFLLSLPSVSPLFLFPQTHL